jgi:pilus assembly protein CpaE
MFTVYVVSQADIERDLSGLVKTVSGATLIASRDDLHEALGDCAIAPPGILLLDDRCLEANPGLIPQLRDAPYPVVLVTPKVDPGVTRRALAIRAADLVPIGELNAQLPGAIARYALATGDEAPRSRVLVVFSSKGGVGKTTLATNLAVALGMVSRRPTAIVDLDLQFGDVAALLGQAPRATIHDLTKVATVDQLTLGHALTASANGHVHLLAAPPTPTEAEDVRPETVVRVLELLKETHGYVLVDTAPGFNDINVAALDFADDILLMLTPEVITVRTVKQALDLFWNGFRYPPSKVRLVMNRGGSMTGLEPDDIAEALGTPVRYVLPSDGNWPVKAANQGVPLLLYQAESQLARAVRGMAQDLFEETEGRSRLARERRGTRRGLWGRVLRRG